MVGPIGMRKNRPHSNPKPTLFYLPSLRIDPIPVRINEQKLPSMAEQEDHLQAPTISEQNPIIRAGKVK
jgi:hypothetical protein